MTTKKYLNSFLRLYSYGQVGRMLSPEAKLFFKDKEENPNFIKGDNIFEWLIRKALVELDKEKGKKMKTWENLYAGYIIREAIGIGCCYIGPSDEMFRVALPKTARRFTKQQALDYVKNNKGDFIIENAK